MDRDLLTIYVDDHLALAKGGLRLAERCRRQNATNELGQRLATLIPLLQEDRAELRSVARVLGLRPSALKEAAAVLGELLGRLKLNGRILGYSGLSRLVEVEGLVAGSSARAGLWRLLAEVAAREPACFEGFDFAARAQAAEAQTRELERLRMQAGQLAFLRHRPGAAGEPVLRRA
jgi:hypothetical protein